MPGRCSKAPRLGIEGTRRRGTLATKKARSRCPDDARLDALDRREVVGHEMPRLAIVPGPAVHSRVVLLINDGRILRVPDHLVDARGEILFFEQLLLAVVPDPGVVHSPGAARIVRREDPRGRDPNEHSPGVAGIREDRVEAETTTSGLPLFPAGVVIERVVGGPRFPAVLASEQSRRFDSRIETPVLRGLKLPDPRDGDPGLLRESGTFMGGRPLASEVLRPRDNRPPELARGARIYRLPVRWIEDRMPDFISLEIRSA